MDVREEEEEDRCRRKLTRIISRTLEKNYRRGRANRGGGYEKETMEESRLTGGV